MAPITEADAMVPREIVGYGREDESAVYLRLAKCLSDRTAFGALSRRTADH
ncbi:MAG TPA: hypothetical protein VG758_23450 [Hyphomicrobiaceae bacterium]|nr:hypothetical protein [Hyphomicrobiaceae bacterium]